MRCPKCLIETLELYGFGPISTFWYCFKCLEGFEVKRRRGEK